MMEKKSVTESKCNSCGSWEFDSAYKADYSDETGYVRICPNCGHWNQGKQKSKTRKI